MPLRYAVDSPVEFCDGGELARHVKRLKRYIADWMGDYDDATTANYVSRANEIIGYAQKPKNLGLPGGVYVFNGAVVGVVQIVPGQPWGIENIITHPAYSGAGATLIEWVVKISLMNRGDGTIKLYAASKAAADTYQALGFRFTKDKGREMGLGDMILSPNLSSHWSKKEIVTESKGAIVTYALNRYDGKNHAIGFE